MQINACPQEARQEFWTCPKFSTGRQQTGVNIWADMQELSRTTQGLLKGCKVSPGHEQILERQSLCQTQQTPVSLYNHTLKQYSLSLIHILHYCFNINFENKRYPWLQQYSLLYSMASHRSITLTNRAKLSRSHWCNLMNSSANMSHMVRWLKHLSFCPRGLPTPPQQAAPLLWSD